MAGRIHRSAAGIAFVLELAALFLFSVAFGRHRRWQRQQAISMWLAACAGVALLAFGFAMQLDVAPGLAERVALAIFLAWEIWVAMQLIRRAQRRHRQRARLR